MFSNIIELIENKKYQEASSALKDLLNTEDEQTSARANYMLGYINTLHDYKKRNQQIAKRHLRINLNSNYPHPYGYVLYARVEEDTNIALNYLEKGLSLFPQDARILAKYFDLSSDKNTVVQLLMERNTSDPNLMSNVIDYLISTNQWDKTKHFTSQFENNNPLNESEQNYLDLIKSYALLFAESPDYTNAQRLLEKVIKADTDNLFAYSHYIGLIYAHLKLGNISKAIDYFDRIPASNSIADLDEWLQPLWISISFESLYKIIFDTILNTFSKDSNRKLKANALYSLYLYSPSETYGKYRYKKSDATILTRYLKTDFNKRVAVAVYNMRCHFRQFEDAYEILWMFLKRCQSPDDSDVFFSEILDNVNTEELNLIAEKTVFHLKNSGWDTKQVIHSVFNDLVKELHRTKQYSTIQKLADCLSTSDIMKSECAFECAFAYAKTDHPKATIIYEAIVDKNPSNSSARNNLGVRYEHAGDLQNALTCYEKANFLTPNESIYQNNIERVQKLIRDKTEKELIEISNAISIDEFEAIGYTNQFCRKLLSIQDLEMRELLQRDLRECAIAVVAGQDKMATIMCGSIIEAVLMLKLKEHGILKYDISSMPEGKKASSLPLEKMVLNELLYVADKEKIIDKSGYHLGHYIRDYRNVVHPAKEIRMSGEVSHDNVLTMWGALKRIILDVFA